MLIHQSESMDEYSIKPNLIEYKRVLQMSCLRSPKSSKIQKQNLGHTLFKWLYSAVSLMDVPEIFAKSHLHPS